MCKVLGVLYVCHTFLLVEGLVVWLHFVDGQQNLSGSGGVYLPGEWQSFVLCFMDVRIIELVCKDEKS